MLPVPLCISLYQSIIFPSILLVYKAIGTFCFSTVSSSCNATRSCSEALLRVAEPSALPSRCVPDCFVRSANCSSKPHNTCIVYRKRNASFFTPAAPCILQDMATKQSTYKWIAALEENNRGQYDIVPGVSIEHVAPSKSTYTRTKTIVVPLSFSDCFT